MCGMDEYKLAVKPRVYRNILEAYNYIKEKFDDLPAAQRRYNAIMDGIKSLSVDPYRVRLIESEPWNSLGYRRFLASNYYIVFKIDEGRKTVYVFDLIFARSDFDARLHRLGRK